MTTKIYPRRASAIRPGALVAQTHANKRKTFMEAIILAAIIVGGSI
jgi:hypothetical protein